MTDEITTVQGAPAVPDTYIYLASPYSHADAQVREARFAAVAAHAAHMLRQRQWLYAPIMHTHHMAIAHELPYEFEFWHDYNKAMILTASAMRVLRLDGWENSRGIRAEIEFCGEIGKPVEFVDP